jgi:RloB-like protein
MRKFRNIPIRNPSFAMVVDGETEVWYLQMLKRNERQLRVNIKPEIPHKKSLHEQFDLVSDLANKEFSKVFWIVDLDSLIKEENEATKGKISSMKCFENYREKLIKSHQNVSIIVNNPCLEFWFLLHFEPTAKYFDTCAGAEFQLKKHLKNYEKTQRFFTKHNDDIYLKLKPFLPKAIANATALGHFDPYNSKKAICEMFSLFQENEMKSMTAPMLNAPSS